MIVVECINGNPEACAFARELTDALAAAGWRPTMFDVIQGGGSGVPPKGLFVQVNSRARMPRRALILLEALADIGFPAEVEEVHDRAKEGFVGLVVGSKP